MSNEEYIVEQIIQLNQGKTLQYNSTLPSGMCLTTHNKDIPFLPMHRRRYFDRNIAQLLNDLRC